MGGHIIGLYRKVTKVKRSYHRARLRRDLSNSRQAYKVGILYSMHRRDISRRCC